MLNHKKLVCSVMWGFLVVTAFGCTSKTISEELHSVVDGTDFEVLPEEEKSAAEALQNLKAVVSIEEGHVTMVRCNEGTFDNESMAYLAKLPKLKILILTGKSITDEGLHHLQNLKNLARVNFIETGVSSEGVRGLQSKLRGCRIHRSKV